MRVHPGDIQAALERANGIWERARSPKDLKPAAEELEEGRCAMLWAREVLAGRTPMGRGAGRRSRACGAPVLPGAGWSSGGDFSDGGGGGGDFGGGSF